MPRQLLANHERKPLLDLIAPASDADAIAESMRPFAENVMRPSKQRVMAEVAVR